MITAPPSRTLVLLVLVCLCAQNSVLVLSMRYTRSVLKEKYSSSSVVVMMELLKFVFSYAMCTKDESTFKDIVELIRTSLPMAIPGFLYVLQNSLQLLAIKYLDASTFAILSQLKILTTAVCSVLMLGTHLSPRKWRALGLLVIGAVLVQYPSDAHTTPPSDGPMMSTSFIGLCAVLGMVCLSGLAGIYLEKFLKNKVGSPVLGGTVSAQPSLWERNLQLSLYGIMFALASAYYNDAQIIGTVGFFHGFSPWTWLVVVSAAGGGLIVAVVVKYTNTIVKGFATSMSIIITSLVSLLVFPEVDLPLLFWLGVGCTLISIFNYNEEDPSAVPAKAKLQHTPEFIPTNPPSTKASTYKRMMEEELMGTHDLDDHDMADIQTTLLRNGPSPIPR